MRRILTILGLLLASSSAFAGAFNGSGTFVRSYNWTQDAANGIPITASRFDTEDNGFATGLSTCVTKNGQTTVTANLPLSGFRMTGVGDASSRTMYPSSGQVQDNALAYCSDAGSTSNTYVVGASPVSFNAYTTGQLVWFRAATTNTASSSINVNALGAKPILKNGTTTLSAGDIISGTYYGLMYDGITSSFVPVTPMGQPGTVQSVGLLAPSIFTVSGSPVTVSGSISLTLAIEPSNTVLAGPASGVSATPTFRNLATADMPAVISVTTLSATTVNARNLTATVVSATGIGLAKAWVKFNGNGGCTVNASYNVASCTRSATGAYGISFTTPLVDTNYVVVGMARGSAGANVATDFSQSAVQPSPTISGFNMAVFATPTGSLQDSGDVQLMVFGN